MYVFFIVYIVIIIISVETTTHKNTLKLKLNSTIHTIYLLNEAAGHNVYTNSFSTITFYLVVLVLQPHGIQQEDVPATRNTCNTSDNKISPVFRLLLHTKAGKSRHDYTRTCWIYACANMHIAFQIVATHLSELGFKGHIRMMGRNCLGFAMWHVVELTSLAETVFPGP